MWWSQCDCERGFRQACPSECGSISLQLSASVGLSGAVGLCRAVGRPSRRLDRVSTYRQGPYCSTTVGALVEALSICRGSVEALSVDNCRSSVELSNRGSRPQNCAASSSFVQRFSEVQTRSPGKKYAHVHVVTVTLLERGGHPSSEITGCRSYCTSLRSWLHCARSSERNARNHQAGVHDQFAK